MRIELRYFAAVREALGCSSEALEVPPDVATLAALRAHLRARGAPWDTALGPGRGLRVALDQRLADDAAALHEGAEVAFFPPVTGG